MKIASVFALLLAAASALLAQPADMSKLSPHAQIVFGNYAAFGRGDVPSILATLAPNCSWTHPGNPAIVPFAGTFEGPEAIGQKFFAVIPTAVEITEFLPSLVGEEGNTVVTSVEIKGKGLATGKPYANTVEMRWTFGDNGKVVRYEALVDPAALEAALTK